MYFVIGADLGGTYCRVAAFWSSGHGPLEPLHDAILLRNADYGSFAELLADADRRLAAQSDSLDCNFRLARIVCIAAAGVYHPDSRKVTRPGAYWDGVAELGTAFDACDVNPSKIHVRNDFEAQVAYVLSGVAEERMRSVLPGEAPRGQFDIVLGPGTGLGVAAISPESVAMKPLQRIVRTEFGNSPVGYPLTSRLRSQWGPLVHTMESRYGITSPRWEDFLSGPGLERLYHCLETGAQERSAALIGKEIAAGEHASTRETFAELLALRCRDLCFGFWLPKRIILTGGVLDKTPQLVTEAECFESVFRALPVAEEVLGSVPVYLLNEADSGVVGAGWLALQLARQAA